MHEVHARRSTRVALSHAFHTPEDDVSPRADDEQVLELARQEQRILLTEDKDFGRLVYADQQATGGVILIRYPAGAWSPLSGDVVQLVADRGNDLVGRFVVMRPGRYRLGPKKP